MPIPAGLNARDGDEWFHFCLPFIPSKLGCFLTGKGVFCGAIAEWEPSLFQLCWTEQGEVRTFD